MILALDNAVKLLKLHGRFISLFELFRVFEQNRRRERLELLPLFGVALGDRRRQVNEFVEGLLHFCEVQARLNQIGVGVLVEPPGGFLCLPLSLCLFASAVFMSSSKSAAA